MTDCSIGAWSGNTWSLLPTYRRLIDRLKSIAGDYLIVYWPEEAANSDDGILHQELSTIVDTDAFDSINRHTMPTIMDGAVALIRAYPLHINIEYRGLVLTQSGISMVGYSMDTARLVELRHRLASLYRSTEANPNNIINATCACWKAMPPDDILLKIRQESRHWSESVFGSITISEWTVGTSTLHMRPSERYDYKTVRCPLIVHHRGNSLSNLTVENNPIDLKKLVHAGHYIELDVWTRGEKIFVGHDRPDVEVTYDWLLKVADRAFIHCKDGITFSRLKRWFGARGIATNLFYHTHEDYALSTGGWVITYPGKQTFKEFLSMMPESAGRVPSGEACAAICSDKLTLREN